MSNYYSSRLVLDHNYLKHHGILGQKWGIRRFQNPDGSLTEEGKKRYGVQTEKQANRLAKYQERQYKKASKEYERQRTLAESQLERAQISREKYRIKGNTKKVERLDEKIADYKNSIRKGKRISDQVLKDIGDMDWNTMQDEIKSVWKQVAFDTLLSVGTSAILLPTAGMYMFTTSTSDPRAAMREKKAAKKLGYK